LVRRVSQLPCFLNNISVVLAAGCTLNPGCQDLGLFCRSFLRGTPSSSVQASVPSDALVRPRLDFLLMSRMRALGSGLFGCSVFRFRHESNSKFVTNPSGTTPRGRKPVTVCSRRFLVWLVGGGVFGSWDRCVWLCRGFRWTLVQRRGGPPLTTLGGALFRPPKNIKKKNLYRYIEGCGKETNREIISCRACIRALWFSGGNAPQTSRSGLSLLLFVAGFFPFPLWTC
jgi:hypothetical protein